MPNDQGSFFIKMGNNFAELAKSGYIKPNKGLIIVEWHRKIFKLTSFTMMSEPVGHTFWLQAKKYK